MKRSCLIFLELAIIWSQVYSSEAAPNPSKEEVYPWAVTVLLPNGRSYNKSLTEGLSEPLKKAYEKVLCGGVIVKESYIYVAGMSVEGIEPKDLIVFHESTGNNYTVTDIRRLSENRDYALLVLSEPITAGEILPIVDRTHHTADANDCLVSEFWASTEFGKVPRVGRFFDPTKNGCFYNEIFILPEGRPTFPYDNRSEYGSREDVHYASPMVCRIAEGTTDIFHVVGFYAWSSPVDNEFVYQCGTSGETVSALISAEEIGLTESADPTTTDVPSVTSASNQDQDDLPVPARPGFFVRFMQTISTITVKKTTIEIA